jgi:TolA-binding protein
MDAPALVSSPTLYVTAQGEVSDAPKVADAPKPHGELHAFRADRAERIPEKTSVRPSLARRMLRAFVRFVLAVLIGVCGTFAWQRYGDQATEIMTSQINTYAASLAQFFTPSESPPPRLAAAEENIKPPAAPASDVPQEAKLPDARDATELQQQLKDVTADLANAKKTIEQLSATQDQLNQTQQQMAQSIAKLQTLEQGLGQKPSTVSSTTPAVRLPTSKPAQHRTSPPARTASKPPSASAAPYPQDRPR